MTVSPPTPEPGEPAPLRLLQVVGGAADRVSGVTGVERVAQTLVAGLHPKAFTHFLAYPATGALYGWFQPRAQELLTTLPTRRLDRAWVRTLLAFLRSWQIDVVLSHGLRYDFLCGLACRRARVPHVVSRPAPLVDEVMPLWRKIVYGVADAWTLHTCRGIITVSEAARRRMQATQQLAGRRVTVIPNGVHVPVPERAARTAARARLGLGATDCVLGGTGRLVAGKGFERLVRVAGRLRSAEGRPITVVVLGEGPEREALQRQARASGVRLVLPGYVEAPQAYVANFDIAVLPSRAEGVPLAVLESMALGVPTVATAVGGIPEVIVDGETGLLVPVDDEAALGRALQALIDSEPLRVRLGSAAARRVREQFGLEAMLARFATALWQWGGRSGGVPDRTEGAPSS